MIRDVTDSNLEAVRAFLEQRPETSVFLLYCLERHGPRLVGHRDSGNFRAVVEAGQVVGVCSPTRRGHLLVDTGGREDLGADLLEAARRDAIRLDAVIGEWAAARSVWTLIRDRIGFQPTLEARQVAYCRRVDETPRDPALPEGVTVRLLDLADFEQWYPLFHALERQEGGEIQGTKEEIRARFAYVPWRWWGVFKGAQLVAIACIDCIYRGTGHLGGIYVHEGHRRQGMARLLLARIFDVSRAAHGIGRLVLFSREENESARQLYESLGFGPAGHFAFMLGGWPETPNAA